MNIVCALLFSLALAAASTPSENLESYLVPTWTDEGTTIAAREKILKLQPEKVAEFVTASSAWLTSDLDLRSRVVQTYEIILQRPGLDRAVAQRMLTNLETSGKVLQSTNKPSNSAMDLKQIAERALLVSLAGKAGILTTETIDAQLKMIQDKSLRSADRLARVTALTDAMQAEKLKPTAKQLERLLENDVSDIRMHAIDWYRLAGPSDAKNRAKFLKVALKAPTRQVRERAFAFVASMTASEVKELSGESVKFDCEKDKSDAVRISCAEIKAKSEAK